MLEKLFQFRKNGTNARTEIIAGVTTFMTMAYILAVNPLILSNAGMDRDAVFTATALSSFVAIMIMAFYANLPIALAPGMGLNAFFAYTVVIQMGFSWEMAITAVFIEGIIFILTYHHLNLKSRPVREGRTRFPFIHGIFTAGLAMTGTANGPT